MQRVLRAADYRRTPWKNGLGESIQIAVGPEGAGLEAFDWRVSMARVETSGPFSEFAAVDRTLIVLNGCSMRLEVSGSPSITLGPESPPHSFVGDRPTQGLLNGAGLTDFNVMTRRGRLVHRVERVPLNGGVTVGHSGLTSLWFVAHGRVTAAVADTGLDSEIELGLHDSLLITGPYEITFQSVEPTELLRVEIAEYYRNSTG